MTKHEHLVDAAKKAVENLFSDSSVSPEQTKEDLGDILDDCQMKMDSLGLED